VRRADRQADEAVGGVARRLFGGGGEALFAQRVVGGVELPAGGLEAGLVVVVVVLVLVVVLVVVRVRVDRMRAIRVLPAATQAQQARQAQQQSHSHTLTSEMGAPLFSRNSLMSAIAFAGCWEDAELNGCCWCCWCGAAARAEEVAAAAAAAAAVVEEQPPPPCRAERTAGPSSLRKGTA